MKIELKNIKHSETLSEETNAFTATLYVNDVRVGHASNHGRGGPTEIHAYGERGQELIKQAEEWCKTLPPIHFQSGNQDHTLDMDLELYIEELLTKHLQHKDLLRFRKKIENASKMGIVLGVPDESYRVLWLQMSMNILLAHPAGPDRLIDLIKQKALPQLKDCTVILNKNIPEKILKAAGLTKQQYVDQNDTRPANKKANKKGPRL